MYGRAPIVVESHLSMTELFNITAFLFEAPEPIRSHWPKMARLQHTTIGDEAVGLCQ